MRNPQRVSDPTATPGASSRASRLQRISVFAAFAALVCSGATSCSTTQIALSVTAIAAVGAGTAVGITLAVQNSNHTLQGCLISGPIGLELRTSDAKIFAIEGEAATIKVGDRVKLHGSKVKKTKGAAGDQVFVVEKLKKDYGPCRADALAPAAQPK